MKAVITGTNRGIGLEFCKQLKAKGYEVIAICRKASKDLLNLNVKVIEKVDVKDFNNLKEIAKDLPDSIDLLINNAGIYLRDDFKNLNFENIQEQFNVNSIAPLKVVSAFLDSLKKNSKIVMITSILGSISNTSDISSYGYRASKAALNMISKILSYELKPLGISVGIFHPGYVKTDMTNHKGNISPKDSVQNLIKLIDILNTENTGSFWHENGDKISW